jgi:predicted enzyme related to lactoylglutathione lyase
MAADKTAQVPVLAYATLSSPRADRLVAFYQALLASEITFDEAPYTVIGEGTPVRLAFQQVESADASTPVHIDLHVTDLARTAERVERLGGRLGDHHTGVGSVWRQAFDPDGNVFCMLSRPDLVDESTGGS